MSWAAALLSRFFVHPGLLAGALLLAAPIIIHFLNKRHFKLVDWAAMDFLLQAASQTRRRLRLEDLILLLLRMLVLLCLVLAVARPLLKGSGGAREDERIVILDDSPSMEARSGAGTAFSAARAAAAGHVEDAVGRSIPVSVWSGSAPERSPLEAVLPSGSGGEKAPGAPPSAFVEGASRLLAGLRDRQVTDVPLRVGRCLQRLAERMGGEDGGRTCSLVWISDFRGSDWFEEGGRVLRGEISAGLSELSRRGCLERLRWSFIAAGESDRENSAVVSIRVDAAHPVAGVPLRVIVEARNFGTQEQKFLSGEIEVGEGQLPASSAPPAAPSGPEISEVVKVLRRVPLPGLPALRAGESASVEVKLTLEEPGTYLLSAKLGQDGLERDNTSFAVVEVRAGLRALVVDGDPGEGRFTGEAAFVVPALAPRGALRSGIVPRRISREIRQEDLAGTDVVFLCNRGSFSEAEARHLWDFVRRGGGAAFFLGNRVSAGSYKDLLPAGLAAAGDGTARDGTAAKGEGSPALFPWTLGDLFEPEARAKLIISSPQHPAFEVFRGIEGASLGQVGFDKFFAIAPARVAGRPPDSSGVVARFNDPASTPAIAEASLGKGKVAVFNTSADRDWNDWPADPSYPVVLQEWVRHLSPRKGEGRSALAGELISWEPSAGVRYAILTPRGSLEPPDGQGAEGAARPGDAGGASGFSGTLLAGFYCRVASPSAPGASVVPGSLEPAWYACRREARESDLTPADEERLRGLLGAAGIDFFLAREQGGQAVESFEEGEAWRFLALGAGLFLLVELFAAYWFGRR